MVLKGAVAWWYVEVVLTCSLFKLDGLGVLVVSCSRRPAQRQGGKSRKTEGVSRCICLEV